MGVIDVDWLDGAVERENRVLIVFTTNGFTSVNLSLIVG